MVPKSLPGMQTAVQGDSESVSKQAVRILSTGPAQTRSRDVRQYAVSRAGFCLLDQLGLSLSHSHGRPSGLPALTWGVRRFTAPLPRRG